MMAGHPVNRDHNDDGFASDDAQAAPALTREELRQRALGWLARRDYSRLELQRRLMQAGGDADAVAALLDDFCDRGWLSDLRFAESRTQARQARTGTRRIANELRELGVADDIIQQTLAPLRDDEFARARTLWQKKFGRLAADAGERARQYRFLLSRGFPPDVVRRVVAASEDD